MTAATTLRTARRRAGLTQEEVARRTGMTQSVISDYERARREPSVSTLSRLVAGTGAQLELRLTVPGPDLPPLSTPEEHAAALVDVLLLADAIPRRHPPDPELAFPRINSRGPH